MISDKEVAEWAGFTPQFYNMLKHNKRKLTLEVAKAIAEKTGMTLDSIASQSLDITRAELKRSYIRHLAEELK